MKIFLIIAFLLSYCAVVSQDVNDLSNRQSYKLKVVVDRNSVYEMDIKASPYFVKNGIIQIYPGESVYIEIEEQVGRINSMKIVKENKNPEKTIKISLSQISDKHIHQNTTLQISNPFERDLVYSVKGLLWVDKKWRSTNVLPVKAGLSSIEIWPEIILSMVLFNWKFEQLN